jgi:hypothetical protein
VGSGHAGRRVENGAVDGEAYLEKLIADRLGAGRGQPSMDLVWIRGVAVGLVAAGALAQQDMERTIADLERTLESTGRLSVVRRSVGAAESDRTRGPGTVERTGGSVGAGESDRTRGPGTVERTGAIRPRWREAILDPPPPVLRKVISLAGRTLTIGERLTPLISLDVWSTMLTLRLAHSDPDSRALMSRLDSGHRWRGWDDAGTQFRGAGGSSGGSNSLVLEHVMFEPGPATHARTLALRLDHDGRPQQLTIALDDAAPPG